MKFSISDTTKHHVPANPNESLTFEPTGLKTIYLAGGCFWGLEAYMSRVYGVFDAVSGYANGKTEHPTYEQVCRENTGHAETVRIDYDPNRVPLKALLAFYFKVIDPTSLNRQGGDAGAQYRTGIYFTDPGEATAINEVIQEQQQHYNRPIVVEVEALRHFYEAEAYHQDYLEKNPNGYCHIDLSDVEEAVVEPTLYKKPEADDLKLRLTDLQLSVTQESATERPFQNLYWDFFEKGLYVDVTTGEPLFLSGDKFESSCGWPSFTKPVEEAVVKYISDHTHGMSRVEVRSRVGDAHLGHVFDDGPRDKGGKRFCINSASLQFVPFFEMEVNGYGYMIPSIR